MLCLKVIALIGAAITELVFIFYSYPKGTTATFDRTVLLATWYHRLNDGGLWWYDQGKS